MKKNSHWSIRIIWKKLWKNWRIQWCNSRLFCFSLNARLKFEHFENCFQSTSKKIVLTVWSCFKLTKPVFISIILFFLLTVMRQSWSRSLWKHFVTKLNHFLFIEWTWSSCTMFTTFYMHAFLIFSMMCFAFSSTTFQTLTTLWITWSVELLSKKHQVFFGQMLLSSNLTMNFMSVLHSICLKCRMFDLFESEDFEGLLFIHYDAISVWWACFAAGTVSTLERAFVKTDEQNAKCLIALLMFLFDCAFKQVFSINHVANSIFYFSTI